MPRFLNPRLDNSEGGTDVKRMIIGRCIFINDADLRGNKGKEVDSEFKV